MKNLKLQILDTTLRDGSQMEGISFSVNDKIKIAHALDEYGIDYIEGGFPGSNAKEKEFFKLVKKEKFKNAQICAFGSTRYKNNKVEEDPSLKAILNSGVKVAVIFGKTWDFQVKEILETSLNHNLDLIYSSIEYLKKQGLKVIFDAEHFFDGYFSNAEYALQCLKTAQKAGAINLSLCDTNGGTLPIYIEKTIKHVLQKLDTPLGIHTHNDTECANANTLTAVNNGVSLIHVTVNGYGERTGNANLCSVVPNLLLKMKRNFKNKIALEKTTALSLFISETANLSENVMSSYVGKRAFTHKAGIHASGMAKNRLAYEHINPKEVGNNSNIIVSELAGKSNIVAKIKAFNLDIDFKSNIIKDILDKIKENEKKGLHYEGADASLYLLIKKTLKTYQAPFEVLDFLVIDEKNRRKKNMLAEATIKVKVQDSVEHMASSGNGPVNALDSALRKALKKFFPIIKKIQLLDYKVRILEGKNGTESFIRVLIESKCKDHIFSTVGASGNIIEASFSALLDAYSYAILKFS